MRCVLYIFHTPATAGSVLVLYIAAEGKIKIKICGESNQVAVAQVIFKIPFVTENKRREEGVVT